MKLKRTFIEKIENNIEVELPYYSKSNGGDHYFCVYGTGDWDNILVVPGANSDILKVQKTCLENAFHDGCIQITRVEFETAYNMAMADIKNTMEEIFNPQTVEPFEI